MEAESEMKTRLGIVLITIALLPLFGCSDAGPKLGKVKGTVVLGGEPLEGASVEFHPLFPEAKVAYSTAMTDEQGSFEMQYGIDQMGVLVGNHQVQITTRRSEKQADGSNKEIKERVPPWYFGPDAILEFDVQEGENAAEFDLSKKKPKDWPPKLGSR